MNDITVSRDDRGRVIINGVEGRVGTFVGGPHGSGATIDSLELARAIAHAILDADRHPMEAKALARVEIIDVAAHAREMYGAEVAEEMLPKFARPLPEHSYRFRGNDPARGADYQGTYGVDYTATEVMASIMEDRRSREAGL
jgi:hypothetical protein